MATLKEQREQLTTHLRGLLEQLYEIGDGHDGSEEWERHRARVAGFQEAGRVLGVLDKEMVQALIEEAHFKVFEETRDARKKRIKNDKVERGEWDDFDKPAYERYRSKS